MAKEKNRIYDGYFIRAHRLALRMTQNELGYMAGTSGTTVSLIERGKVVDSYYASRLMDILRNEVEKRVNETERGLYGAKVALLLIDIYRKYERNVPEFVIKNARMCCKFAGREKKDAQ